MARGATFKPQRLPSGRWRVRWLAADGTRPGATFTTEAAARAHLRRMQVDADDVRAGLKAPPVPPPTSPLFSEFLAEYTRTYVAANNKASSRITKERVFRTMLSPTLGARRLDEIGLREVEELKANLLADGYARRTVNNGLISLAKLLSYAHEVGVLGSVPKVRLLKLAAADFDFLDDAEYARLVAAAADPELRAMVLLAGDAGLRSGELRALTWDDADIRAARVTVRWGEYRGVIDTPKGGRPRTIDLTRRLAAALAGVRHLKGPRVFCGPGGELLTEKGMTYQLEGACKRAGLRAIGWHVLRHTFISHLAMRGAPARAIQELAGHANLTTTQRYMHLSPNSTRQAIDLLEADGPRSDHAAAERAK